MFPPWRNLRSRGLVGIEASPEGIAIAQVANGKEGSRLVRCEYISREAVDSLDHVLPERVQALRLGRLPCNWVLTNSNYTLLLVEAPKVPPEEMREAMRWRIKDLISFPVEQATLDIFALPDDGTRGKQMLYVVVAERQCIQNTLDTARSAKITLKSIDIAELALRNIAELVSPDQRGLAIVRLRQGAGNVALIRQGKLYLSRQFDLKYNAGLLDDLPEEALVLELQRSLDYYERQMGQGPPAHILFCGDNVSADKIGEGIRASLPGEVSCLNLRRVLPGAEQCDEHLLQLCLGAIGGALRREAA
ncbi:MAG: MSHA biogenesis protein MshI [Cellvibrionaceae bacterium]